MADSKVNTNIRGLVIAGFMIIIVGFGGFAVWAAVAPLNSAAIALGVLVVESNRKAVQHLEGGIIQDIFVKEGEPVKAGQLLVHLEDMAARTRLQMLDSRYVATLARYNRLHAERLGEETISFAPELLERSQEAMVFEAMDLQQDHLRFRLQAMINQKAIVARQILQIDDEIEGLEALIAAGQTRRGLIEEEIRSLRVLVRKGLAKKSKLSVLEREAALINGQIGEQKAKVARAQQRITEARLHTLNKDNDFKRETIDELQNVQNQIEELSEAIAHAQDVLRRTEIRSPQTGIVVDLKVHTTGGVIKEGDILMEIVPQEDELVVEAMIRPEDIDVVNAGMSAQVRLTAYNFRTTPPVPGKVLTISADRIEDERTGMASYLAKVRLDAKAIQENDEIRLYPGMPAEVMIVLGGRTFFDYMASPILRSLNRSVREQ